jgi:hypothetical protein
MLSNSCRVSTVQTGMILELDGYDSFLRASAKTDGMTRFFLLRNR